MATPLVSMETIQCVTKARAKLRIDDDAALRVLDTPEAVHLFVANWNPDGGLYPYFSLLFGEHCDRGTALYLLADLRLYSYLESDENGNLIAGPYDQDEVRLAARIVERLIANTFVTGHVACTPDFSWAEGMTFARPVDDAIFRPSTGLFDARLFPRIAGW